MNKNIIKTFLFLTTFIVCLKTFPLEAKHHRHTRVQVGIGSGYAAPTQTVVRRYPAPVAVPVYPMQPYYAPGYLPPGYVYAVPAYPTYPGYVEEVYTVQQRPVGFTGLSFSWNFFR
jgi:hypothetical protein